MGTDSNFLASDYDSIQLKDIKLYSNFQQNAYVKLYKNQLHVMLSNSCVKLYWCVIELLPM